MLRTPPKTTIIPTWIEDCDDQDPCGVCFVRNSVRKLLDDLTVNVLEIKRRYFRKHCHPGHASIAHH